MSKIMELARRMAELSQKEEACRAYTLALQQGGVTPEEELEAAAYLLFSQGEYRVAYTTLVSLHQRGAYRQECLHILTQAFYEPNVKLQQTRYEKNCRLLKKYPYLFRQDFPRFEELPIRFYPYDDKGYIPFDTRTEQFGAYVNFNHPVVSRNFFADLENPILAADVFSQYELEYLHDNVRKSEWVGRENHIYLHYTDWAVFCAYLQCLNLGRLLAEEKLVFLIGDEVAQYPIDFKARFGIDYSKYPLKPVGIREVNRLIWHTQLSSHNGGDFFNEIMYDHPNVISYTSIMHDNLQEQIDWLKEKINARQGFEITAKFSAERIRELLSLGQITEKDALVAIFLGIEGLNEKVDPASRITPVLMLQPHFHNIVYDLNLNQQQDAAVLDSAQLKTIQSYSYFREFKYIKTFTPMRRPTTSYAASVRFMEEYREDGKLYPDVLMQHILNRSYMIGPNDKLCHDSVIVRFEDGKLNPKATFTALAAFLDIPYTESMTYCSGTSGKNPESLKGNVRGFDPATVYRTYDDYADDAERALMELLMQDVYKEYEYDFQYYKGEPIDDAWVEDTLSRCNCLTNMIKEVYPESYRKSMEKLTEDSGITLADDLENSLQKHMEDITENRRRIVHTLLKGLQLVNQNGQPLHFMKKLELDPALLEQPLYH